MASISFDPNSQIPLARPAANVIVARYDPKAGKFSPLPNIVCAGMSRREGASPAVARMRYQFDPINLGPGFPARVEDVAGLDKKGPFVIRQDDRLVVLLLSPDGQSWTVLFDGFAQVPQVDLSDQQESATFQCLGKEIRCWDTPLGGAVYRDLPDPSVIADTATGLPSRFNPDGHKNRVPDNMFSGADADTKYPVFLDLRVCKSRKIGEYWSIDDAAKYILHFGNDGKYVQSPSFKSLAKLLSGLVPAQEGADANDAKPPDQPPAVPQAHPADEQQLDDPDNPDEEDDGDDDPDNEDPRRIICQDLDVRGMPWPVALETLLKPHNFGFAFRIDQLPSGKPYGWLEVYRTDDADSATTTTAKLQSAGSDIDPGKSNVVALTIERDGSSIANEIVIDTEPVRREAAFILSPGFTPSGADAVDGTDQTFNIGDPGYTEDKRDKYRLWVFDETGEGHWDYPTASLKTTIPTLDPIFGPPDSDPVTKVKTPRYADRRRPGLATLFSTKNGKRLRARLHISNKWNGSSPCVYDNAATDWQEVIGGWELLPDRLGIRITEAKITQFTVGTSENRNPAPAAANLYPIASGSCNLVKCVNNTPTPTDKNNPRLTFRLTCVIEGDMGIDAVAKRRPGSITPFSLQRRVDTSDRFVWHAIDKSSPFYVNNNWDDFEIDWEEAVDYAEAIRAAHENCDFSGHVVIPRITGAYRVGDKVTKVEGREISLRTNAGAGQGIAAQYPIITGIDYAFEDRQSTTLLLSSRKPEPPQERTKARRR